MKYKYEIGKRIIDDKRDIMITDKKYITKRQKGKQYKNGYVTVNIKYYKYKCNKCGFDAGKHYSTRHKVYKKEYWIEESSLLRGGGCACCSGRALAEGINDIPTTNPEMIKYFSGGYEEAKLYTRSSNEKIYAICPDCGKLKAIPILINTIYNNKSINCSCSDFIPYGEKLMFSVLRQLGLDFITQLSKTTFKWCGKYRYDFYFKYNDEQYIIETHGGQHYDNKFNVSGGKTIEEEKENDRIKKELALNNQIKEDNYIIIDCRKSESEYIKQNILNSKLNEIFCFRKIDWIKVSEFACSNLVKEACEYKKNNPKLTTGEIGKLMGGYCGATISRWLKRGNEVGWCNYNAKNENNSVPVICLENEIIFKSIHNCEKNSFILFGIQLHHSGIINVCCGKTKQTKGYTFKYIKDLTQEEYIKYDIENKLKQLHNQDLVQAV